MKNFRDYLKESEEAAENPVTGDVFAVNIREECLVESVVLEHAEDGVVIAADDRMLEIFESYGITLEDVCMECGVSEGNCGCNEAEHVEEIAPVVGAIARTVARNAVPAAMIASMSDDDTNEARDPGEYGEEGDMAKNELATIIRAARRLTGMLDTDDDMPEWTQKKITKAADYVDTAADYIASQKERGIMEQPEDSNPVARAVLHRIMMQHPGVLATHGPERVMAAVDELADRVNIGPDDEIGTSDVSGWTRDVIRMLAELPDEPMNVGDALDESGVAEGRFISGLEKIDRASDTVGYKKFQHALSTDPAEKKKLARDVNRYNKVLNKPKNALFRPLNVMGNSDLPVDEGVAEAEIDDTWMNDRHREFYKRNPHFKRNDRERVEVGRGTQLATRVKPSVEPAQVQKKPATRFGMGEAEYQGRDVELNKPKRGGPKKFYVYVKNPKTGNVKKVTFGDPNMKIKKSNPDRRKSFRARHRCDNPGPKTSARYWACRAW
jgi:hypothetical protein